MTQLSGAHPGPTVAVVRAARELSAQPLDAEAATVARHCLLDWLGVALAGSREPLTDMLAEELAAGDEATVLGRRGARASAPNAALVNGAAGHALDFDDTHMMIVGHVTAAVAPAVLALGERLDSPGADVLAALVAGAEAELRLGLLVMPSHYALGWHATGTLGTFGAAAGCASLLGLAEDDWLAALGIAGTQAAGLKAVFGTMSKPLHAGKAAMNGLLAATLAARGFTSRPDVVEAHQGFAATHAAELAGPEVLDAVAGRYLIRDTLFKYHAACYLTHSAIDAALELGVTADDVDSAEVRVAHGVLHVAGIGRPRTGLESKFSVPAVVAMALRGDDTTDPRAYGEPAFGDLIERIAVVPEPRDDLARASVTVRTRDGRELQAAVDSSVPSADLAEQGRRLAAKFDRLAGERAARVRDAVERIETLRSVRDLTALAS